MSHQPCFQSPPAACALCALHRGAYNSPTPPLLAGCRGPALGPQCALAPNAATAPTLSGGGSHAQTLPVPWRIRVLRHPHTAHVQSDETWTSPVIVSSLCEVGLGALGAAPLRRADGWLGPPLCCARASFRPHHDATRAFQLLERSDGDPTLPAGLELLQLEAADFVRQQPAAPRGGKPRAVLRAGSQPRPAARLLRNKPGSAHPWPLPQALRWWNSQPCERA